MINIYEILKDCPYEFKLYSIIFGQCKLIAIGEQYILVQDISGETWTLDQFGKLRNNGECVLFPSKEQLDWSKFVAPQPLPKAGELCWTMSSVGNWTPRYATCTTASNGMPIFFCNQSKKGESNTYVWRKWCDFEELIKSK